MRRSKRVADELLEGYSIFEPEKFEKSVRETMGNAPYEFLDASSPFPHKFPDKKRRTVLSEEYRARNPAPNYANFGKPDYLDEEGREYRLASGPVKESLVSAGEDTRPDFQNPQLYTPDYVGTKAFWVRLPIDTRWELTAPASGLGGESITLFQIETQVLCTGVIDSVYFRKNRKTGYMVLRDFATLGKASDPSRWQTLPIARKRGKKTLF